MLPEPWGYPDERRRPSIPAMTLKGPAMTSGWAFAFGVDEAAMSYLEAALIVLALGTAAPAVAHTLLEARRNARCPRHWAMV